MTAKLLASCLLLVACAAGQDKPATPQRGQLEFKLDTLSRSERGDLLTAAITVTNKSPYYVFFLLVGKPHAINDAGEQFDVVESVDGVAYCKGYDSYHGDATTKSVCIGTNPKDGAFVPPEHYTEIEPDQSAVFTIVLGGPRSNKGEKITLTQEYAFRFVTNVESDQKLPEKAKMQSVLFKSLHFNAKLKEVVSSSITFGPVK